ncbi:carbohydrate ABC transporter permease [Dictyobacter kobayashii]|uniref:Sugar ABC transporter permease n=1 Tax=Dictyobacter kobayashii TaxID=2014872 RepID=A0A402AGS4_9CHLR|nr:sugar ABC transporter permease [Dictyobacter kobayashii]GCE18297.1 sugar ABC transporter permease [Dictyobacter kobayashii]
MEYQVSSLGGAKQSSSRNNLRRRQMGEAFWGYFFILPQMIGLVAFALYPLISVFIYSANNWDGLGPMTFVGFQNYIDQLNSPDLHIALTNTLYYTVLTVPGGLILALLVALGLNNVRGKTVYRVIYFMPVVTSSVAVAVIWGWLLNSDFGLINVLLKDWFHIQGPGWITDSRYVIPSIAMLSIWGSLGFNMIIFLAGLQGIPATYAEAARIDGANRFQLFFGVTLPMLTPTLFFTTVLSVISSFQVFDQTFVLTGGGPGKDSYTIVYHIYHLGFETSQFGSASAAAVILFVILLALTLAQLWFQRRWVTYDV